MAKAKNPQPDGNRSPKQPSNLFHNIMRASVKGGSKTPGTPDFKKMQQIFDHVNGEVGIVIPDYKDYLVMQINPSDGYKIFYNINNSCPKEKYKKIEEAILKTANSLNLKTTTEDIE